MRKDGGFVTMEEHLDGIGWLDHMPPKPYPRRDVIGEMVYSARWNELMRTEPRWDYFEGLPNAKLAHILHCSPYWLSQEQATVCARIVCWFGSNCGRDFVDQARKRTAEFHGSSFIVQWALENRRQAGINNGYRALEHLCMAPEFQSDFIGGRPKVSTGFLTPVQIETADLLMEWLSETEGLHFLSGCIAEMEKLSSKAREYERRKWQEGADRDARVARLNTLVEAERKRMLSPDESAEMRELLLITRITA